MLKFQEGRIRFRVYATASAVLLIFILVLLFRGGEAPDTRSTAKVFKMGEEVQSQSLKVKVNSVQESKEVKTKKTLDNYYMVSVSVQNTGKEARKIESSMFRLISKDGEVNLADEEISKLANGGGFIEKQLNPGLSATGYIVFEIRKGSDKAPYVLEVYENEDLGEKVNIKIEN